MLRQKLYKLLSPLIDRNAAKKSGVSKFLRKLFSRVFIPSRVTVMGSTMYLHKAGHSFELAFEGGYELLEVAFLRNLNLQGRVVADVGSCIGYYALILTKVVGEDGKVFAFEPESKNYNLLQRSVVENRVQNIFSEQLAVGNAPGEVHLRTSSSPGQHQLTLDSRHSVKVSMVSLDSYFREKNIDYASIGYVKIDVEGNEYGVLQGMVEIIKAATDLVIQFEYAPQHLQELNCDFNELFSFIRKHQFKVYYWDLRDNKMLECEDVAWFLEEKVINDFKRGILYSRNIILSKMAIGSVGIT